MLTTIFRLGPLVLLEFGLSVATLIIWLFMDLPSCTYYTLGYITIMLFLIEMIASMRMMKSNPTLRRSYFIRRVTQSSVKYCIRSIWDNLNILFVVMLLYYSLIVDGITLYNSTQSTQITTTPQQNSDCQYTLFALCLFNQLQKTLSTPSPQDIMAMWLLLAASGFLTTIICVSFSKQYYGYCSSVASNRKLKEQLGTLNQTLMDCHIYSIKGSVINESVRDCTGECSICLGQILEDSSREEQEKVVRLRCKHLFHKECLDLWLKVRDHCPFRCNQQ